MIMHSSFGKGNFLLHLNLIQGCLIILMCHTWNNNIFFDQSRVVQLANGERSFHIFYQLCAGATKNLKGNALSVYQSFNNSNVFSLAWTLNIM